MFFKFTCKEWLPVRSSWGRKEWGWGWSCRAEAVALGGLWGSASPLLCFALHAKKNQALGPEASQEFASKCSDSSS